MKWGTRYPAHYVNVLFRSVGRHLRSIRAGDAAVRVLEAGVTLFPRYSQLRASLPADPSHGKRRVEMSYIGG